MSREGLDRSITRPLESVGRSIEGEEYFEKVQHDGEIFKLGDTVEIQWMLGKKAHFTPAQILFVWRDSMDELMMEIRWFYKPLDFRHRM